MIVTFSNGTSTDNFTTIKDALQARLEARLGNAGNVGDPEPYSFLSSPACDRVLCEDSYPQNFTTLGFAFKKSTDPAGQYPLRRIQACTAKGVCVSAGCDVKGSDVGDQQNLDIESVSRITGITTFYCRSVATNSDEAKRYGSRIIGFVVSYEPVGNNPARNDVFAAPDSLLQKANNEIPQNGNLWQQIDISVSNFNRNNQTYKIWQEVNDSGLRFLLQGGAVRRSVVNLGYSEFQGDSRSYIGNVSLLSAIPGGNQIANIFTDVTQLKFDIPFIKNPLTYDLKLIVQTSNTEANGNVSIYQNSTMHSFKIPSVKVAGVVDFGGAYSYSSGEQTTQQKNNTRTSGTVSTFELTVSQGTYVVRGFPSIQRYNVNTVIGLLSGQDPVPKYEITVPTGAPCLAAGDEKDLAQQIMKFI